MDLDFDYEKILLEPSMLDKFSNSYFRYLSNLLNSSEIKLDNLISRYNFVKSCAKNVQTKIEIAHPEVKPLYQNYFNFLDYILKRAFVDYDLGNETSKINTFISGSGENGSDLFIVEKKEQIPEFKVFDQTNIKNYYMGGGCEDKTYFSGGKTKKTKKKKNISEINNKSSFNIEKTIEKILNKL